MNFIRGLNETFSFLALLTMVAVLVPYLLSSVSYAVILLRNKSGKSDYKGKSFLIAVTIIFSLSDIIGSGLEAIFWDFVAILLGIPFYVWMKRRRY